MVGEPKLEGDRDVERKKRTVLKARVLSPMCLLHLPHSGPCPSGHRAVAFSSARDLDNPQLETPHSAEAMPPVPCPLPGCPLRWHGLRDSWSSVSQCTAKLSSRVAAAPLHTPPVVGEGCTYPLLTNTWEGPSFSVVAVLMRVFYLPLKFRLCSEFQDAASGKVLYKNLLASLGVSGLPAASPVPAPKDRPSRGHVQQEEQQQPSHAKR